MAEKLEVEFKKLGISDVVVHVINIGQGDSILVELVNTGKKSSFYLVDGGNKGTYKPGEDPKEIHLANLERTLRQKGCLNKEETSREHILDLKAIIITHPDNDHIGGINRLVSNCKISCPIITTDACHLEKAQLTEDDTDVPAELIFPKGVARRIYRGITPKTEIKKDDSFPKKELNESSILFNYAHKILLTGDSEGEKIHQMTGLGRHEEEEEMSVTVFQVPHHGGKKNSFIPGDAKPTIPDDHPLKSIKGKHDAYKHALFFMGVQAKTYFISHGDNAKYQHPHRSVVTGILLAHTVLKQKCTLVVTGSFHQDKIQYPPKKEFPQIPQNWNEYVTIKVPENGYGTPFITISSKGEVSSTKEWHPEPSARPTRGTDRKVTASH